MHSLRFCSAAGKALLEHVMLSALLCTAFCILHVIMRFYNVGASLWRPEVLTKYNKFIQKKKKSYVWYQLVSIRLCSSFSSPVFTHKNEVIKMCFLHIFHCGKCDLKKGL